MKTLNIATFIAFILTYGAYVVFQYLSGDILEGDFAAQENSYQMFLYILVFLVLSVGVLINLTNIKGQDRILYLVMMYIAYYVISTVLFAKYFDIKYIGTGVIMSTVSQLAFVFFYFLSNKNYVTLKMCIIGFALVLGISIASMAKLHVHIYSYSNNVVITYFYILFLIMPWMLCLKNDIIIFFMVLSFGLITSYSGKRGAFLSLFGAISAYYFIKGYIKSKNILRLLSYSLIILPTVLILMYFYIDFSYIIERMSMISEDRGSGRLDIYMYAWESIKNSSIMQILFGKGGYYGFEEITKTIGIYGAHNDYIESLINIGIFGLLIVLSIVYRLLKNALYLCKISSPLAPSFASSIILLILLSNISKIFVGAFVTISIWAYWGYIIGYINRIKENENPLIKY